jgi:aminoglycoside 3-N-acetyltransferase
MIELEQKFLKKEFSRFVTPEMKILIHSSLSSIGLVKGGAHAVIRALMEIITPNGLIMMPAFTYGREPFDIFSTPAQTGRISETFRRMEGVERSMHPTHSFCAWGKMAEQILSGHSVAEPFKIGTPLHKFGQQDGYVLLIGVTQVANSLIHVAQELAQVPYLNRPKVVKFVENGELKDMVVLRAGCSLGFDKITPYLETEGLVSMYKIGQSKIVFMKSKGVLERATEVLRKDPYFIACDNPNCFACNEMRAFSQKTIIK